MIKHFLKYSLWLCVTLVALSACHSTKVPVGSLVGPHPEQARFKAVVANNFKYDTMQSKVRFSMGSSSLNGKMCLASDELLALLVNAPLLGFEVGRIEATKSETLVLDKMHKVYAKFSLSDMSRVEAIEGHEFEVLECLILGRIYIPGRGLATSKDYDRFAWQTPELPDGSQGNSTGVFLGKDYVLEYEIDASGQLVSTTLALQNGYKATFLYSNYVEPEKGKRVPATVTIKAVNSDQKEVEAGMTLNNPSLGENTWRRFEPSDNYRQVTAKEIGEGIKNMQK